MSINWGKVAPIGLGVLGIFGAVMTLVAAVVDAKDIAEAVDTAREEKGEDLTILEEVKAALPKATSVVAFAGVTAACACGSGYLCLRQARIYEKALSDLSRYIRNIGLSVANTAGPFAAGAVVREATNRQQDDRDVPWDEEETYYLTDIHGTFFESTREQVSRAEYLCNRKLAVDGELTVNDMLGYFRLPQREGGDRIGWSVEDGWNYFNYQWLDFVGNDIRLDDGAMVREITVSVPAHVLYMNPMDQFRQVLEDLSHE